NLVSLASTTDGTGSTTVYAIDAKYDALVTVGTIGGARRSPDTGRLYTIAPLGLDASDSTSFDISGAGGVAFISTATRHGTGFYSFDIATGVADGLGVIGDSTLHVTDIALYPESSPSSTILGLTSGNALL